MLCPACENESTDTQKCTNCGWEFINFTEEPTLEEQNEYSSLLNNYRAELYWTLAARYYDNKQYEEVIECCKISCEHNLFENPLGLMASAYFELGNKEEALNFANMSLNINPKNEFALFILDALNENKVVSNEIEKLTASTFEKNMFESTREHIDRVNSMGMFEVGIARLKEYDADAEIYTIECEFHKEVVDLIKDLPVLNIKMKLPRDAAKELYLQGENHNIYAHITYDGSLFSMKEIGFNKYPISKLIEAKMEKIEAKKAEEIEKIYKLSTYYDKTSGLVWQDTIDCKRLKLDWNDAMAYANNFKLGDYNDWSLPSKEQLVNLLNNQYELKYNISSYYWSSSYSSDSCRVWNVDFKNGRSYSNTTSIKAYVRCVRAGQ